MMEQSRGQSANLAACEIDLFISAVREQNVVHSDSLWKASFCISVSSEANRQGREGEAKQNADCYWCLKGSDTVFWLGVSRWQRSHTLLCKHAELAGMCSSLVSLKLQLFVRENHSEAASRESRRSSLLPHRGGTACSFNYNPRDFLTWAEKLVRRWT